MGIISKLTDTVIDGHNYFMYEKFSSEMFDFVGLMLSRKCNANCIFCPVHKQKFKKHFMEMRVFNKVIKELKDSCYLGDLNFGENGDALLHPKFREMFAKASKDTMARLVLYSNMGNMGKSMSKFVLENGLDSLTLNIDGASPRTYQASKRGLNYEVIQRNLLQFIDLRDKINPKCTINISIISPVRYHEMRSGSNLSLDYDVPAIKKYWSQYLRMANSVPRKEKDTISESSYFYNWANPVNGVRMSPCPMMEQLYKKIYINVEGYVYPCCLDYKTSLTYGNVKERSLRSIWSSKRRKTVISKILEKEYKGLGVCNTCNETNDFIFSKINKLKHEVFW